jgi:thiamine kinase-like enzyme
VVARLLWQTCGMLDDDKIKQLPCWNGRITITPLAGGLSNVNYRVEDAAGRHVVRFGVDYPFHHVSREREVMVARAAHAAGLAPRVQYAAPGVMVSEFLDARTFVVADVKVNAERVGRLISDFHQVMPAFVSGPGFMFWPFHVIRDYVRTLRGDYSQYLTEAAHFEAAQMALPIVFGHHDLLPANVLDDGKKLWLIDFEYAGFGTAMFDLAGASSNAAMNADERTRLLMAYFGKKPDVAVLKSFAAMECASLMRETLWAMVSGLFLAAPGVDYAAYTIENRARYDAALDAYQIQYGKIHS